MSEPLTKRGSCAVSDLGTLVKLAKASNGGLSDDKLAARVGSSRTQVIDWKKERRFPTPRQLLLLCEVCGEDPAYWAFMLQSRRENNASMARRFRDTAQKYAVTNQ